MIYGLVLATHIVIAIASIAALVLTGFVLVRGHAALYKRLGVFIAACAALETISGVLLVALSPEISAMKVGLHLALYLSVCMLAEGALIVRASAYGLAK